ncbi:MAG: hypothetical protein CL811_11855 [Colwelliaceae bacterium]|nr:hypothetical protein [Colwelliaceae bacterium]
MSEKRRLITKIHVAKAQLSMDEESYRSLLVRVTGKNSCSGMNVRHLELVMEEMKSKGFKVRNVSSRRLSPKSKGTEIDKIRAIWITMFKQGFVRDGSESALDNYTFRIANTSHVGWLKEAKLERVLESLKNWHRREMAKKLIANGLTELKGHRTAWSTEKAPYDYVKSAYEELTQ